MGREFVIDLSPNAEAHLDGLRANERRIVLDAIEVHLRHQPLVATRHRKTLDPNDLATWELRVREFRVFYDVESKPERVVWVRAIGRKRRDRLYLGDQEYKL